MMTKEARQALRLRLASNKASVKKLPKILEQLSPDDRLRFQYAFYKAHTGRWAGKGAQLQNLKAARTKEEKALVPLVIKLLLDQYSEEEISKAEREKILTLDSLSLALRSILRATKGKKIVLADFSSVENRVLAWTSGCEAMMEVYRQGKDPYIDFAARMEGCDYAEVTAEMRQQAKPGTLGCGFGLGGGQLVRRCKCSCKHVWNVKPEVTKAVCPNCFKEVTPSLPQKTGLWRYAEMMGIDLSQEQALAQVEAFRETFYEVSQWWYYLEEAFAACCLTRRPQKITSSLGCTLTFKYVGPFLQIVLPSGRSLFYANAFARTERTQYGKKLVLGFETFHGKWCVQHTYGGRLCENIVQAIARDCLADAMIAVEDEEPANGMKTVGHTHDELITEAYETDYSALGRLLGYMSRTPKWAPGLILKADGHEGKRYEK